jgi:hypothetical protein
MRHTDGWPPNRADLAGVTLGGARSKGGCVPLIRVAHTWHARLQRASTSQP